jgi:DNA-binding CsgD family transcriptional regulator
LVGAKIKTVSESFADFTKELGYTVNPLYKSMVTDLVGTTHLIVVCARFQQDALWSLGIVTALDMLLKNYPEPEGGARIQSALFKSVGLDEDLIRKEAKIMEEWATGKTKEEIAMAMTGEGDSILAKITKAAKEDEYWMYSRYFGIGLIRIMEIIGVEMDRDEVYPVMEEWMGEKFGKRQLTACVSLYVVVIAAGWSNEASE